MKSIDLRFLFGGHPSVGHCLVLVVTWLACRSSSVCADEPPAGSIKVVCTDPKTDLTQAVIVEGGSLIYTGQLFPIDPAGEVEGKDVVQQAESLLQQVERLCKTEGASATPVKLNCYVTGEAVTRGLQTSIANHFRGKPGPAVSFVQTRLPVAGALVALDAVAALPKALKSSMQVKLGPTMKASRIAKVGTLPAGSRVYVSGQAEKGGTLAEATTKTMQSLKGTLQHLGSDLRDIVQVKSFLTPMSDVSAAEKAIVDFFAPQPTPPLVFVEWQSTLPIEIELLAAVRPQAGKSEPLDFITPPGMTASPVFCRVVLVNDPRTIFVSGLFAREAGDGAAQVNDVFAQLQDILKASGSDLRYLAKATYYVSDNDASAKLNELRPKFYDPARPPAASKAQVFGVGMTGRTLTLDMIAVPSK